MSTTQFSSSSDLEEFRFLIEDLYWKQGLELKQVMDRMSSQYHFRASESQYRNAFRRWRLKKNMKRRDYVELYRAMPNLHTIQDSDEIVVEGRKKSRSKLRKEFSRNVPLLEVVKPPNRKCDPEVLCSLIRQGLHDSAASNLCLLPSYVILPIHAPSKKLPWHTFCEILEIEWATHSTTCSNSKIVSATSEFRSRLTTTTESESSNLMTTLDISKFWDQNLLCDPHSLYKHLQNMVIEAEGVNLAEKVGVVYRGEKELGLYYLLQYFVFLESNNKGDQESFDRLIEALYNNNRRILQVILSWNSTTAAVILQKVMFSAVRLRQPGLLRLIRSMLPSIRIPIADIAWSLVRYAVKLGHIELVTTMIEEGVDIHGRCAHACSLQPQISLRHARNLSGSPVGKFCIAHLAKYSTTQLDQHCVGAFFVAVVQSPSWVLERLIKANMDLDVLIEIDFSAIIPYVLQMTPLQAAIIFGTKEHVAILFQHSTYMNHFGFQQSTTKIARARNTYSYPVYRLKWPPITLATIEGDLEMVEVLCKRSPDLFAMDAESVKCDEMGGRGIFWLFGLSSSASAAVSQTRWPCTALEAAMLFGSPEIFERLLIQISRLDLDHLQCLCKIAIQLEDLRCLEILQNHQTDHAPKVRDFVNGKVREVTMQLDFLPEVVKLRVPSNKLIISFPNGSVNTATSLSYHIALACMCRMTDPCPDCRRGHSKRCPPTPCEIDITLRLLEQDHTCHGEKLTDETRGLIWSHLIAGQPCRILSLLEIPEQRRCFKDVIVYGRRTLSPAIQHTCDCSVAESSLAHSVSKITNIEHIVAEGHVSKIQAASLGYTPLSTAIVYRDIEVANLLLKSGADPNFCKISVTHSLSDVGLELTSLGLACWVRSYDLIEPLINAGASLKGVKLHEHFWSSITSAVDHKIARFCHIQRLLDAGADINSPSHCARYGNDLEYSQRGGLLCWASASIHDLQRDGQHRKEQLAQVKYLLDKGADVNALDQSMRYNASALQKAAGVGDQVLVDMYLERGGDINREPCYEFGRTALQAAAQNGRIELVEHLLYRGADVHAAPSAVGGVTALQAAAIEGFLPIAEILIQRGASVSQAAAREEGRTALEGAAEHGRLDMIQLLLNHYDGQDRKEACMSAAEYAEQEQHFVIAQYLRDQAEA